MFDEKKIFEIDTANAIYTMYQFKVNYWAEICFVYQKALIRTFHTSFLTTQ